MGEENVLTAMLSSLLAKLSTAEGSYNNLMPDAAQANLLNELKADVAEIMSLLEGTGSEVEDRPAPNFFIAEYAKSMRDLALEELERRKALFPNTEDRQDEYHAINALVEKLAHGYGLIHEAALSTDHEEQSNPEVLSLVEHLRSALVDWVKEHGKDTFHSAVQVPAVAVGIYALSLVGLPTLAATAISGAIVANDKLAKILPKISIGGG